MSDRPPHPDRPATRTEVLLLAIEALQRISDVRSAMRDHPGRGWSYRDYELRDIARHALTRMAALAVHPDE